MKITVLTLACLGILLGIVLGWARPTDAASPPTLIWRPSPTGAVCVDSAFTCPGTSEAAVCMEICLQRAQGGDIPLGVYCCFPEGSDATEGLGACETGLLNRGSARW